MAYATISDVRGILPRGVKIDGDTADSPTGAFVTAWLDQVTGQVNVAYATGGATTPITDADTLLMLQLFVAREVVYQVMATRESTSTEHDDETVWDRWHNEFLELLEGASEGDSAASASGTPSSYTMESPSDTDESINPQVYRGREF
jgi:hypothetical protein